MNGVIYHFSTREFGRFERFGSSEVREFGSSGGSRVESSEGLQVKSSGGSGGSRVREIREIQEFGRFVSQEFGRSRGCDLVTMLPSVTSLDLELSVPKLLPFIQ